MQTKMMQRQARWLCLQNFRRRADSTQTEVEHTSSCRRTRVLFELDKTL